MSHKIDAKAAQLFKDIIVLLDHLKRETEETKSYYRNHDYTNALRNKNSSRDELETLVQKWKQLHAHIVKQKDK